MTTNWKATLHHCLGNGITSVGYQVDESKDAASNTIMTNQLPMPIGNNWQGNGRVLNIEVVDASGTVWTGGGPEGVAVMSPCSPSPQ